MQSLDPKQFKLGFVEVVSESMPPPFPFFLFALSGISIIIPRSLKQAGLQRQAPALPSKLRPSWPAPGPGAPRSELFPTGSSSHLLFCFFPLHLLRVFSLNFRKQVVA